MSSDQTVYYNNVHRHGVDDKRRVQIPSKWRPDNGSDIEYFLISWPKRSQPHACLLALAKPEWESMVQKLKAMPYGDPMAETLRRLIGKNSERVTPDKAGRICLPEEIARRVGIEKDVVLVGLVDRFELWNPEKYAKTEIVDDELAPEAYKLI